MDDKWKNTDNPYYISFLITTLIFKNNDIVSGVTNALNSLRIHLNADYIAIFKDNSGEYLEHLNSRREDSFISGKMLEGILNNTRDYIESNDYVLFPKTLKSPFAGSLFVPVNLDNKYIFCISGVKDKNIDLEENIEIYLKLAPIIMEKMDKYDEMLRAAYEDELTGLENRRQFNNKMSEIDNSSNNYVFGIFDLFRLKYVNDVYSHDLGDEYIKKAANILKKYFPKIVLTNYNGIKSYKETGTSVYRIGGDEFVVISDSENIDLVRQKAELAAMEVENLDIAIANNLALDLNYGIVERVENENWKELYFNADKIMQKSKTEIYKVLGIDRRK